MDPSYQPTQFRLFNPKGSRFLSKPSTGSPLDIALKFLRNNAAKLGVSAVDFANPLVTDQYTDAPTGVTHIYLRQQFNGLERGQGSAFNHSVSFLDGALRAGVGGLLGQSGFFVHEKADGSAALVRNIENPGEASTEKRVADRAAGGKSKNVPQESE